MFTKSTKTLIAGTAMAIVLVATPSPANAGAEDLSTARAATAGFHQIESATSAGYGEFRDRNDIACIASSAGVMGIHYVKGPLVGDGTVNAATPEALVYQPQPNGKLRLVAVEYIVIRADWDAAHASRPSLFGESFTLVFEGNRYNLPDFYELHAWIWEHNPSGTFADFNPRGTCGAQ
jgi:hypothetical protein